MHNYYWNLFFHLPNEYSIANTWLWTSLKFRFPKKTTIIFWISQFYFSLLAKFKKAGKFKKRLWTSQNIWTLTENWRELVITCRRWPWLLLSVLLCTRHLSRFFWLLSASKPMCNFGHWSKKWPLSHLHISYQSLAECH